MVDVRSPLCSEVCADPKPSSLPFQQFVMQDPKVRSQLRSRPSRSLPPGRTKTTAKTFFELDRYPHSFTRADLVLSPLSLSRVAHQNATKFCIVERYEQESSQQYHLGNPCTSLSPSCSPSASARSLPSLFRAASLPV